MRRRSSRSDASRSSSRASHIAELGKGAGHAVQLEVPELVEGWVLQHDVSSMEVSGATDIGVIDRRPVRGLSRFVAIEVISEDGGDGGIGVGADLQGPPAGGLQPVPPMGLGQAQDADTRPEALFGMRPALEDYPDQSRGVGAGGAGLAGNAFMGPTGMAAVR